MLKFQHKIQKIAKNLRKLAGETTQVQYFSFFPNRFEASNIFSELDNTFTSDWDYALVKKSNVTTGYKASDYSGRWVALDIGKNPWRLVFLNTGSYNYDSNPELKRLAK